MSVSRSMRESARAIGACCALFAFAAFSSAAWAQAGYVHEISGLASIQREAGTAAAARVGDTFESNTIFHTGTDGKVTLKFADGEVVALSPDSSLRVGRYNYVPGSPRQSGSIVELMKGTMRFVTGQIGEANREEVRIIAGDSMIRILKMGGADFTVVVNPDPREVGAVVVALGEISVRTPYGQITKVEAGQYAPWQPGRSPPPPMPIAAAPAVIQASVAALWSIVLPANTPVAVASAARTAAATATAGPATAAVGGDQRLAGYVDSISNTVSIRKGSGGTATASAGTTFGAGTTFDTGTDGRVVLKFADGEIVVLGPASVLAVGQYQFDPGNARASRSTIELVDGAMRFITGTIHTENHEGISITAGASIIDILNTGPADFTVVVNTVNQEVGVARVALGEISVFTPYGPINKIEADKSNIWGPRKTPESPIPVATELAVVQAAVELQLLGLPDNTPVAVAPAARLAAATAEAKRAQAAASADPANPQLRAAAQAAAGLANLATQAATAASDAGIMAKAIATMLQDLPPTSAGPALAQVPAAPATAPGASLPTIPTVTPGAGGGCRGSKC